MFRVGILPALRPRSRAGAPEKVVSAFLRLRLCGGRFMGGSVPLSLLGDISSALGELIVAAARHRFLAENPQRERTPKGFTQDLRLAATGITAGSAVLQVSLVDASGELPEMPRRHHRYYEGARDDFLSTIRSAAEDSGGAYAGALSASLLPHFDRIGRGLGAGESMQFDSSSGRSAAVLTADVRKRLLLSSSQTMSITEEMPLRGSVPEADQDRKSFQLQLISGRKLTGPMPERYRETILEAFRGYRDRVKIEMEVVGTLNRQQQLRGWQEIRDLTILDPLEIASQLEELRALNDGWLDGDGLAPPPEGLDRLDAQFEEHYPERLPLPRIYPTPTGGAQLEWTLGSSEVNVEVNLATGEAEWHVVDVSSGKDELDSLDLNTRRGWCLLVERIERLTDSLE